MLGSFWIVDNKNNVIPMMSAYDIIWNSIEGVADIYVYDNGSPIDFSFTVIGIDKRSLTSEQYSYKIKNSKGETVSDVTDIDTYTLTITGIGDYYGERSVKFKVKDVVTYTDVNGVE